MTSARNYPGLGTIARGVLLAVVMIVGRAAQAQTAPQLFFYPPAWALADGPVVAAPLTVDEAQATTQFPFIAEMDGVAVIVNWSTVCPTADHCSFAMVDHIIDYWRQRHRKIVLGFATVGFPTPIATAAGPVFTNATPDWVLDQVSTYTATVPALATIAGKRQAAGRYPYYSDPRFIGLVQKFVHQLARFDGNDTIAQLRMSVGLLSEDNANPVGRLQYQFPGFSHLNWVAYCRTIMDLFTREFHHTTLEFDAGLVGWISALGTPAERAAADALFGDMVARKVFLAFDGWSDATAATLSRSPPDGVTRILQVMQQAQAHGAPIGLEAIGPISNTNMQNVEELARALTLLRPARIVMFPVLPAYLKAQREGNSASTKTAMDFLNAQPTVEATKQHIDTLIRILKPR